MRFDSTLVSVKVVIGITATPANHRWYVHGTSHVDERPIRAMHARIRPPRDAVREREHETARRIAKGG